MKLTEHAKHRYQQRGISLNLINLILQYGDFEYKPGGALEYYVKKKDILKIQRDLKILITRLEKLKSKGVLVIDNKIVTVYHKNRRNKNGTH